MTRVRAGESVEQRWSSGNTKNIPVGSRVFLLKQGNEPRGLMLSGWTVRPVQELPHWDDARAQSGDLTNYVWFAIDTFLDPDSDELLDPRDFPSGPAADSYWSPPASGTSISQAAGQELEQLWSEHTSGSVTIQMADPELRALEGVVQYRIVRHRSRERTLRDAKLGFAIERGPLRCEVPGCGFDFAAKYGPLGEGYAQVHHRTPLSSSDTVVETTLSDLAIVCANCHAMIHLGGESRALDSLIQRAAAGEV